MDRPIEKKKWPLKRILTLLAIVSFVLLVSLMFLRPHITKLNVNKDQLFIVPVEKGKFQEFIPVDGVVNPVKTFYLDAIQGGTVEKIYVEDGAFLKKGDTILKLSNASLELDYMNQESRIFDVINNLQNTKLGFEQNKYYRELEIADLNFQIDKATIDYKRKELFYQQNLISLEEYENAKRDYKNLLNQINIKKDLKSVDSISRIQQISYINTSVERMKNNLDILKEILKNLYVIAPVDGQL
ncbi:HlyD family secretion protein, partial [Bacteroidota bacterium]